MVLSEFAGMKQPEMGERLSLMHVIPKLTGIPVWIAVGNNDVRIDTDQVIAFSRALVRAYAKGRKDTAVVPVDLIVAPTAGHMQAVDRAHPRGAAWILRQFGMAD